MDRAAKLVLIVSPLTVFLSGVENTARTCYFGPPPKPDPDNPDHWMKQVMQEIRERCPGKRGRSPAGSWIEVDLAVSTLVSGAITQGGPGGWWYVKRYLVSYQRQHSSDRVHVTDGNGETKVFTGYFDDNTPVTNMFKESVVATTVRIAWHINVGLRFELLGCRLD